MISKYELVLTELNHPEIHGNFPEIYPHYMYFLKITATELYNDFPQEYTILHNSYLYCPTAHPTIRCYSNIIRKKGAFHLNIVEPLQLSTGEEVCILKTFWLRIFQRKWRAYFKKKLAFFKHPKSLMMREINGSFKKSF